MNPKANQDRLHDLNTSIAASPRGGLAVQKMIGERDKLLAEMSRTTPATSMQVGGDHYKNMGMQPHRFATANRWDPGAFSILKYVSRHRSKKGLEDVQKGRHFVLLRQEEIDHIPVNPSRIPMHEFVEANGIKGKDAEVLFALEGWVEGRLPETTVMRLIEELVGEYVGNTSGLLL